jgi:hypothetical protein
MNTRPGHEASVFQHLGPIQGGGNVSGWVGIVGHPASGKFIVKTSRGYDTAAEAGRELDSLYADWCRKNAS